MTTPARPLGGGAKRLNTNTRERQSPANITGTFILTGKLFDETGDRLSPTSANSNGKRHRYYVSRRLLRTGDRSNGGWRLPARQLEQVVIDGVVAHLNDPVRLSRELPSLSAGDTRRLLKAPRRGQHGDLADAAHGRIVRRGSARQSHSSIKIHSVHPPPSIRSILTKAIDGPILVRCRNRTNRPLHWGIIAPPFSDGSGS